MKTKEVWKDVKDYEGLYQVSNLGMVKSLKFGKERVLKRGKSKGRWTVALRGGGKSKTYKVAVLVAIVFLDHSLCGMKIIVDHIDNDKLNDRLDNLQLVSNRENASKDRRGYSSDYVGVCWVKRDKRWVSQIYINGSIKKLGYFINELEASNAYQNALKNL